MTAGEFVWVFGDCVGFVREIYPNGEAAVSIRELNMSGGYNLSSLTPITSVKHDLGDGWRAGRRVRWNRGQGLVDGTLRHAAIGRTERPTWLVDWDAGPPLPAMQDALELLPDEPATPEPQPVAPRFRFGDRVQEAMTPDEGNISQYLGRNTHGEHVWDVQFDRDKPGYTTARRESKLIPAAQPTPEPQPAERTDHYAVLRERGHEPWAVMRACMSREGLLGYHVGTAIAYLMRCGLKHPTPDDDIRKAAAHLAEARSIIEGREAA